MKCISVKRDTVCQSTNIYWITVRIFKTGVVVECMSVSGTFKRLLGKFTGVYRLEMILANEIPSQNKSKKVITDGGLE